MDLKAFMSNKYGSFLVLYSPLPSFIELNILLMTPPILNPKQPHIPKNSAHDFLRT